MTDDRIYTSAERASYQPPPCSNCGSRRVRVQWANAGDYDNPDQWMVGMLECLDCDGRPS